MVVHHVVRLCCCIICPSSEQKTQTGPSNTIITALVKNCPQEIKSCGRSWIVLYIYIMCNGQLPNENTVYMNLKIGEWAVSLRMWERQGKLTEKAQKALSKMPLWNPIVNEPTEKTKLLQT